MGAQLGVEIAALGQAAGNRGLAAFVDSVVENFTWDHFRTRLLGAYELAMGMR